MWRMTSSLSAAAKHYWIQALGCEWPQFKYVQHPETLSPKTPIRPDGDLLSEPDSHPV